MYYNNIQEMYTVLHGVGNSPGVKYDVIKKWFVECRIIDESTLTEEYFTKSYCRLCPNKENIHLTQFIQLLGILMRETKQEVQQLEDKFNVVKEQLLCEIQEKIRNEN